MAKTVLITVLLVVLAGAGGYFFGTYQKFAPIQNVAPGSSANDQSAATTPLPFTGGSSNLQNKYWIESSGDQRIGYAITVFINGQKIDKFFTPGRKVDITKYVKPGENQVNFQAEVLPPGMNEHAGNSSYYLVVSIQSGRSLDADKVDTLLDYKRKATDTENYNDTMTFTTLE